MPERASARRADWAPGPGVFVLLPPVARSLICSAVIPSSYKRQPAHIMDLVTIQEGKQNFQNNSVISKR